MYKFLLTLVVFSFLVANLDAKNNYGFVPTSPSPIAEPTPYEPLEIKDSGAGVKDSKTGKGDKAKKDSKEKQAEAKPNGRKYKYPEELEKPKKESKAKKTNEKNAQSNESKNKKKDSKPEQYPGAVVTKNSKGQDIVAYPRPYEQSYDDVEMPQNKSTPAKPYLNSKANNTVPTPQATKPAPVAEPVQTDPNLENNILSSREQDGDLADEVFDEYDAPEDAQSGSELNSENSDASKFID